METKHIRPGTPLAIDAKGRFFPITSDEAERRERFGQAVHVAQAPPPNEDKLVVTVAVDRGAI